MEVTMAKFKCKCGCEDFKGVAEDLYYMELHLDDNKNLTVKVVDQEVFGDVEGLSIACEYCGLQANPDYDDCEWDWSEVQ